MKTTKILLAALAIIFASATAQAQTTKKKAASTGIARSEMTDARCHLLFGKVKTVKTTTNFGGQTDVTTMKFNANGQLISMTSYGNTQTQTYISPNKYRHGDYVATITYGTNKRTDTDNHVEKFSTCYKFNANGQLVETTDDHDFESNTEKYFYKTATSKLPYKYSYDGGGCGETWSGTDTYQYLATDAQGNWTKRKVTTESGSYTETRQITYY